MSEQVKAGTIIKYIAARGFGFIKCDEGYDRFFHVTGIVEDADLDAIKVGDRVSFTEKIRRSRTYEGVELERPMAIGIRITE